MSTVHWFAQRQGARPAQGHAQMPGLALAGSKEGMEAARARAGSHGRADHGRSHGV